MGNKLAHTNVKTTNYILEPLKDSNIKVLIALIVLLHFFALAYKTFTGNVQMDDSIEYLYMAENISNEGIFYCGDLSKPINPDFFTKRPPLYPLLISAVTVFWETDFILLFFQNLVSLFNILILINLARKLSQNTSRIILMLVLFSPVQIIYANMVMSEIIFQTWILLMVSSFISFVRHKNPMSFLGTSLFLILAMLTKPVMYPFVVVVLITGIFYFFKAKIRAVLVYASLPLLFFVAYNYWNYHRTGVFHFSSIQTINLVQYNTYFFVKNQSGEQNAVDFLKITYQEANQIDDYSEKQAFLKKVAIDRIMENLPAYLLFHTKGVTRWFVDPGRFDYSNFFNIEAEKTSGYLYQLNKGGLSGALKSFLSQPWWLVFLLLVGFLVKTITVLGFFFWLFLIKHPWTEKLALAVPVLFVAIATGPLGASRFMLPLMPLIILAASISINKIFFKKA